MPNPHPYSYEDRAEEIKQILIDKGDIFSNGNGQITWHDVIDCWVTEDFIVKYENMIRLDMKLHAIWASLWTDGV